MILRKPYALFIKYFKVIHFLMCVLMVLILMQTNSLLTFLNETIKSNQLYLGKDVISNVFNNISYFYILLVIVMDVMIWVLMEFKKKKRFFYVVNFISFLLLTVLYVYMNGVFDTMSKQVVDIRLLMTLRDFSLIAFTIQAILLFITITRAIGINVKKFNFESDLKELNLSETDNEEFEVNLDVDYDNLKRNYRTTMRNFIYYVKENIRIIVPIIAIFLVSIGVFIYKNTKGFISEYNQGTLVNYPDYSIVVNGTYITNKNYHLSSISEDSVLVVLKTDLKTTTKKAMFEFGRFSLTIGNNKFYHNIKYSDFVKDIGEGYVKQKLTKNFDEYLLIFAVPKNLINEEMKLIYVNEISAGIFGQDKLTIINLQPINLDVENQKRIVNLNDKVLIDNDFSDDFELVLEEVQLADIFKIKYKQCIKNTDECFEFYEPLQADFGGSYDKAIIKLKISLNPDVSLDKKLSFIEMQAGIQYSISGKSKNFNIKTQLFTSRVKSNYIYYEIPYEVLNAEKVNLQFKTRKNIYVYNISK